MSFVEPTHYIICSMALTFPPPLFIPLSLSDKSTWLYFLFRICSCRDHDDDCDYDNDYDNDYNYDLNYYLHIYSKYKLIGLTHLDVILKYIYSIIEPSPSSLSTINSIIRILAVLSFPHTSICTEGFLQQLRVCALFNDATAIHNEDLVAMLDRRQPVGYCEGCATFGCL